MASVDTAQHTDRTDSETPADGRDPVPGMVDWVLGALVAAVGFVLTAVGAWLYTQVGEDEIAEAVAQEGVQVNGLTESEFVTASGPFMDWLAGGVALTGLVAVGGAAVFVISRRRTRRRVSREGGTTATFWACAVYGAAVTVLVSFIPGSSVAGGGVAAYLHDGDSGIRTGAAAGLVGFVATLPLVAALTGGMTAGAAAIGESAAGGLLAATIVGGELVALALSAGLGALGGYLAAEYA
jgi:hypothetical protein